MPGSKLDQHKLYKTLIDINRERYKQHEALEAGKIPWDCADPSVNIYPKIAVLGEEYGEVCRAALEDEGNERLRQELIQVAAVACAMAESL